VVMKPNEFQRNVEVVMPAPRIEKLSTSIGYK
jgi:hypothetical protein